MKITVTATIGTEGRNCWLCDYARSGGAYCELFRVRLEHSEPHGGGPCKRCQSCLDAEAAAKQPGLFNEKK